MKLYLKSIGKVIHYWYGVVKMNGPCYLTLFNTSTDFYSVYNSNLKVNEVK